jgi:hypothetical protein
MKSVLHVSADVFTGASGRTGASAWWLIPHFLGLDAVLVALIWQAAAAHALNCTPDWGEALALGCTVLAIYSADRLRDSYFLEERARERHLFARRHRAMLLALCAGAVLTAGALALFALPSSVLTCGLSLLPAVAAYFAWTHLRGAFTERGWAKEWLIGLLFAAGVFLAPALRAEHPPSALFAAMLSFGALCALNCLSISYSETRAREQSAYWLAAGATLALQAGLCALFPAAERILLPSLAGSGLLALLVCTRTRGCTECTAFLADMALVCAGLLAWLL